MTRALKLRKIDRFMLISKILMVATWFSKTLIHYHFTMQCLILLKQMTYCEIIFDTS